MIKIILAFLILTFFIITGYRFLKAQTKEEKIRLVRNSVILVIAGVISFVVLSTIVILF